MMANDAMKVEVDVKFERGRRGRKRATTGGEKSNAPPVIDAVGGEHRMPDKIFRDPLYNYISIDRKRDGWLLKLLDCPEVQRLLRIHQLGVSHFTYPGADHNRLLHSLGVVHLMVAVLRHLENTADRGAIETARPALLAAALLHDVGHGPYSHLFEPCLAGR